MVNFPRPVRALLLAALLVPGSALAVDYVSVGEANAILYDAPSQMANKLFVVNRYMPFEQIVNLADWVKVRDRTGGLYWIEKRALSTQRTVFSLQPELEVHAEPNLQSVTVFRIRQQVALQYLEPTGNGWIKVQHPDGETGYVRSTDVWGG